MSPTEGSHHNENEPDKPKRYYGEEAEVLSAGEPAEIRNAYLARMEKCQTVADLEAAFVRPAPTTVKAFVV